MQTEMSYSPTGGLRLPPGKHEGILTDFQTKVKKKGQKKCFFWPGIYVVKPVRRRGFLSNGAGSTEKGCGFF